MVDGRDDKMNDTVAESSITIVISPWQHFGHTKQVVERIYAFTRPRFSLIYVDGNSPKHVQRYLQEESHKRGFTLIRANHYLTTSEAHNLALPHVRTRYVAFLDNNALVTPGWLDALIDCAETTGAWVVGPVYCTGDVDDPITYSAAPDLAIVEENGRRRMHETAPFAGERLADVREVFTRMPCGYAKSHCLLTRKDVLDRLGAFDEAFTSYQDHRNFCLEVLEAGGSIYFEPESVVVLAGPPPFRRGDLPMFFLRWSNAWLYPSIRRFADKWHLSLDDDVLQGGTRFRNAERRRLFSGVRNLAHRVLGWRGRLMVDKAIDAIFERVLEPTIITHLERRRLASRVSSARAPLAVARQVKADV